MKLKFFALIASVLFLGVSVNSAVAELITYNNFDDFEGYFDEVTNVELVSVPFANLGSDGTIIFNPAEGKDFNIVFLENNTAFGAIFNKVTTDSSTNVTVYFKDSQLEYQTFFVEEGTGNGNNKKSFFGITTGGDGYIDSVMVTLGDGANVTNVYHNNSVVPEPTTLFLLGTGLIGLAGLGRKKFFKK